MKKIVAFAALSLAVYSGVFAQTIQYYGVSKRWNHLQRSAAAPITSPILGDPDGHTLHFGASVQGNALSALSSASVTLPNATQYTLADVNGSGGTNLELPIAVVRGFDGPQTLNAAFPNGSYTVTMGATSVPLSLGLSDNYPVVPQVTNGTWDIAGNLVVTAAAGATLNFNTFSGYSAGGYVSAYVASISGNSVNSRLYEVQAISIPSSTYADAAITSFSIAPGLLQPGQTYYLEISYGLLTGSQTSTPANAVGHADFESVTGIIVRTPALAGDAVPLIATQPVSQSVSSGANVVFTVAADGSPTPMFQWTKSGANIPGATNATLSLNNVQLADAATYTVIAYNAVGSATSNNVVLTVNGVTASVTDIHIIKLARNWQNSASAPVIDPSPPGPGYTTPPNNGGPYEFSLEIQGTNLGGITAPVVTLPDGSTYPTENPTRHNGGTLAYDANQGRWAYGVDAQNYSAPSATVRETSLANGTYGLTLMGTALSLDIVDNPPTRENTPSVTLTGGTWVRGEYLINVSQPLTITTNAFTNFSQNLDGALSLNGGGPSGDIVNVLTFYSDNHAAPNILTYTIPANTLVAGSEYNFEAGFYAITGQSTSLAGARALAGFGQATRFKVLVYTGALPSATIHGIGDIPGGSVVSEVRDATRVNDVIYAVGSSSGNNASLGDDTAVIWTTSGGLRPLPNLVGNTVATTFVTAAAITPDAAYIASRARSVNPGGNRVAVRVTTNSLTNLNLNVGGTAPSAATAISSDGSILYGIANGNLQAIRYTAAGPTGTVIPFLAGHTSSGPAPRGCSSDGSVMVGTCDNGTPTAQAFRYVQGTGATAIPFLTGGSSNVALAVSPDGNLTLLSGTSSSAPQGEFYLHNATTSVLTPLGTPNGGRGTWGTGGMTPDGSVVVGSINNVTTVNGVTTGSSASYLHNSHGWHNLQDVIAATGANVTGWTFDPVAGMSSDATLVFGYGKHNGNQEGYVVEFSAGYLAAYDEPATYSTPPASIVGAWTLGDTTAAGGTALIFFPNGYYMHLQTATPADAPGGVSGFERGQFSWNPVTGVLTTHTLIDTNGDIGLSGNDGANSLTVSISGNTLTANEGGSSYTGNRVLGTSPLVGAYGIANVADASAAVLFLPNGYYFMAQDGDSTPAGDPSGKDGMEWGTYTWNPVSGALVATTLVDTNGQWGLSHPQGAQTFALSTDLLTLTATDSSGANMVSRVEAVAAPAITTHPSSQTVDAGVTVVFTAAASGNPLPTYQWKKGAAAIAGATNATLTLNNVQLADAATYTVIASNALGTATSNAATLALKVPAGFDAAAYLARYPDIAAIYGTDLYGAWLYYRDHGIYNGEVFDDVFRVEEYLSLYPELLAVFGTNFSGALVHWLTEGRIEGRLGRIPLLFSEAGYYAHSLTDPTSPGPLPVAFATNRIMAWEHYWAYGIYEGRAFDDEFLAFHYYAMNPDLQAVFPNDWRGLTLHWLTEGRQEGRLGRVPLIFSSVQYGLRNPDVPPVWGNEPTTLWLHYYYYGVYELRNFDDEFRVAEYLQLNPDLQALFGTDYRAAMMHWVRYGRGEGRPGRVP